MENLSLGRALLPAVTSPSKALCSNQFLRCLCSRGARLDFQLNDEQLQLQKSVREFARREILPNVD